MKIDGTAGVTRRAFIKGAALAAGVWSMPAAVPARAAVAPLDQSVSSVAPAIGVLLPQSTLYPAMGRSFLAGLQGGLGAAQARLVVEDTGVGGRLARAQTEKLLREDGVELLVGLLGAEAYHGPIQAARERGRLMIGATLGENLAREHQTNPNLFHASLGMWQASWALGDWAARNVGRTVLIATSFYDSGYDTLAAFRLGFEGGGGRVLDTLVTHRPGDPGSHDVPALLGRSAARAADCVFASYCGPRAAEFVPAYAAADLASRTPLLGSSFLVDDDLLQTQGAAAAGITMCCGWDAGTPDVFALLGGETAQLVAAVVAGGRLQQTEHARRALESATITSSRGRLIMSRAAQTLHGPLYLREIQRSADAYRSVSIAQLAPIGPGGARVAALRSGVKTGWINGYLSV